MSWALAIITGYDGIIKKWSLLTGREDFITFIVETNWFIKYDN